MGRLGKIRKMKPINGCKACAYNLKYHNAPCWRHRK